MFDLALSISDKILQYLMVSAPKILIFYQSKESLELILCLESHNGKISIGPGIEPGTF